MMVSQRSALRCEYIRIVMTYLEAAIAAKNDFRIERCIVLLLALIRDFERKSTTLGGHGRGIPLTLTLCEWKSGREFELLINRFSTLADLRDAISEKVDRPHRCIRLVSSQNTFYDDVEYAMQLDDLDIDGRYTIKFYIQETLDSGTGCDVFHSDSKALLVRLANECQLTAHCGYSYVVACRTTMAFHRAGFWHPRSRTLIPCFSCCNRATFPWHKRFVVPVLSPCACFV